MIGSAGFWLFVAFVLACRNVWLSVRVGRLRIERDQAVADREKWNGETADELLTLVEGLADRVFAQAELLARRAER